LSDAVRRLKVNQLLTWPYRTRYTIANFQLTIGLCGDWISKTVTVIAIIENTPVYGVEKITSD